MNTQEWKQLISAYADGVLSSEEAAVAEKLLAERPECRLYLDELRRLSSSLQVLTDETLSPDAEFKILSNIKKERSMQPNQWKAAATVAATVLVVVLAVTVQTYTKRGLQGRLASATDDIGDQYSSSTMANYYKVAKAAERKPSGASLQYEPYYQSGAPQAVVAQGQAREGAVNRSYGQVVAKSKMSVIVDGASQNENLKADISAVAARTLSTTNGSANAAQYAMNKVQLSGEVMGYSPHYSTERAASFADKEVVGGKDVAAYRAAGYERSQQVMDYRKGYIARAAQMPAGAVQYEPYYLNQKSDYDMQQGASVPSASWTYNPPGYNPQYYQSAPSNTEEYKKIEENAFLSAVDNPLSTLSADVDTASYSNVRRFLTQHQMPPRDSVRIEELINYFSYDYPQPSLFQPFSITTDLAVCPWNQGHQLLRVGLKGKIPAGFALPPSNLVFLIDVSGSMSDANKLPLLKEAFKMMVQQLRPQDYVSIVVYAGYAGEVLAPTSGADKYNIINAIDSLQAGGSTAGGEGIRLAYQMAKQNFIRGGNNRVILATDGDFNVGVSNTADLTRMIENERKAGIFLTILGFGQENLKDNRMMQLADNGNGNYFYIDNLQEAQKVLADELGSTLFAIAKDVKIQIEFNPSSVKAYRLIGYEKRVLAKEDFNNDRKDAGEIGAGHTVTALYEIVPTGGWSAFESTPGVDPLKYQRRAPVLFPKLTSNEVVTVKLRYKELEGNSSKLISRTVKKSDLARHATGDFAWASAVAEFGMLLRGSDYSGNASYDQVLDIARNNIGNDPNGLRAEFLTLVETARSLDPHPQPHPVWIEDNGYHDDYQNQGGGQINFK